MARGGDEGTEVYLHGVPAEFRSALRAEIEAARKSAQSSAIQMVRGERVGHAGGQYQYVFRLENPQLGVPDDLPGDLYIGQRRVDATVISSSGIQLTLS